MILPFQENKLSDNTFIREFKQDTDSGENYFNKTPRQRRHFLIYTL